MRRHYAAICISVAVALGALSVFVLAGFRLNWSPSLPRGVYRIVDRSPQRGDTVLLCPPPAAASLARERSYLPSGPCPGELLPMGKLVAGLPGDTVRVSADGVLVDGRRLPSSAVQVEDRAGLPLPHFPFDRDHHLRLDELWVHGPHPRSFDSRYYGPIHRDDIRAVIEPVWVESSEGTDG